jgi:hypothetical protein
LLNGFDPGSGDADFSAWQSLEKVSTFRSAMAKLQA